MPDDGINQKKMISVVVLAMNEEKNLPELYRRLSAVLKILPYEHEVLIIDNASQDGTEEAARKLIADDACWKYIRFSRNFTAENSLAAGMHYATGDAVVNLVSDLQDPPEIIKQLVEKWEQGYDVVYGLIEKRNDDSLLKSFGVFIAYKLIHWVSDCKIPPNAGSCQLLTRQVVNALDKMRECDRYYRGLTHWAGFSQIGVPYERAERRHGETKAGFLWCIGFALTAILNFSSFPLRLASYFGLAVSALAALGGVAYLLLWLVADSAPPGIMTLILLLVFSIGIQATFLGIIGEYIGRLYKQVKTRPLWIVHRTAGFGEENDPLNDGVV